MIAFVHRASIKCCSPSGLAWSPPRSVVRAAADPANRDLLIAQGSGTASKGRRSRPALTSFVQWRRASTNNADQACVCKNRGSLQVARRRRGMIAGPLHVPSMMSSSSIRAHRRWRCFAKLKRVCQGGCKSIHLDIADRSKLIYTFVGNISGGFNGTDINPALDSTIQGEWKRNHQNSRLAGSFDQVFTAVAIMVKEGRGSSGPWQTRQSALV